MPVSLKKKPINQVYHTINYKEPAMNTRIYKDYYKNWIAETTIMLSETHQLTITTSKGNPGKVSSHASVGHVSGDFVSHAVFSDFSKWYETERYPRVTEKVISSHHASLDFDSIIEEAKEFYKLD